MSQNVDTKVITGTVRLSYAHVWEPKAIQDGQDEKYSACLLIPKSDTKTIENINRAIEAAKQAGISKFGGQIPKRLKTPLRDGDTDETRGGDEDCAGCYFLNASAKTRPGIVDRNRQPILDSEEVYSGCYAIVSVNFYAFNTNGNKGIACGLNHIMKVRDGEYLGGRSRAEDDFADIVIDDDDDDFMS